MWSKTGLKLSGGNDFSFGKDNEYKKKGQKNLPFLIINSFY